MSRICLSPFYSPCCSAPGRRRGGPPCHSQASATWLLERESEPNGFVHKTCIESKLENRPNSLHSICQCDGPQFPSQVSSKMVKVSGRQIRHEPISAEALDDGLAHIVIFGK